MTKVPRKATALKRCTVIESRWNRKLASRVSPVMRVRLRPRSDIKEMPLLLIGPKVSKASGMKVYESIIIITFIAKKDNHCFHRSRPYTVSSDYRKELAFLISNPGKVP